MKKVWLIAWNSLTRMGRDRKALAMLLLMPMILIGILGVALKPMMDSAEIKPFDVILINADMPAKPALPPGAPPAALNQLPTFEFGRSLRDDVLLSDQAKRVIILKESTDLAGAREQVRTGKAVAAIYVPAPFTADVLAGKPATVQVYTDPGRETQSNIVTQILSSFTEALTTDVLAAKYAAHAGAGAGAGQNASGAALAQLPKVTEVPAGSKNVSAFQYYAAAMAIMFMLMTGFTRASVILEERQQGTLGRMMISPTPKGTILAGQMLGSIVVVMAQFLVLMLGTRFIYGVDWGPMGQALLLAGAYSLACAGVGTATAGWLNDPKAANVAVGVVSNIFAALSGAMFPIYIFPAGLKLVAHFIPNYWAMQGFLDQMAGVGGLVHLATPVGILAAIGVIFGALGTVRLAAR